MSEATTTRKVQRLGGSSLIITLPKQWARRLGIKVGDEIEVVESGGKLLIQPKDPRAESRASTVTIRFNGIAKAAGVGTLVDCAFLHGYSRVEILIKGLSDADIRRLTAELADNRKVASVERSSDRLVVSLAPSPESDTPRLIKEASSALQEMLDLAASGGEEADLRRLEQQATEAVEAALRLAKNDEAVDPISYGLLVSLPSMLADASVALRGRADLLGKAKEMVGELLGGIASASGRRLVDAAMIAQELRDIAMHEGSQALVLVPIADAVARLSLKLVCPSLVEQEGQEAIQ